ncbi:MAG: hypothetical protein LBT14_13675, partial [Treponema sp.]|nr:hypothetical protein [Treponema sp.]
DDLADAVVYEQELLTGQQLPDAVCRITWDTAKPNGTPRKLYDISRLSALGFTAKTALRDGIKAPTYSSPSLPNTLKNLNNTCIISWILSSIWESVIMYALYTNQLKNAERVLLMYWTGGAGTMISPVLKTKHLPSSAPCTLSSA